MGNELSKGNFSLPTFEEALRMNDKFSSFLCPYCGKWHRAGEDNKHSFKENDIYNLELCLARFSVNCSNPLYFSSKIRYTAYFNKEGVRYEVVPLSASNNYVTSCWLYNDNYKVFSGEIPYSSFHVLSGYTPDMAEVKYVCDIEIFSLNDLCGVWDTRGCTQECYFTNCVKEQRIQLGFGLKYNPETLDIDTRLKRIAYKYVNQLPEKVFYKKKYVPLLIRSPEGEVVTNLDAFVEWCCQKPGGYNWLYHFIQELLDTALLDEEDKEKSLIDILDLKL